MEILDCVLDYQEKFDGKTCQVFTNYKLLETFKVEFRLTDLHHLFGLHKITRDFASKTIPAILSGVFVLETYRQHPMYKDVKERISLYGFLLSIFYSKEVEYCIVGKDLQKNTMNLDIVFFESHNRRATVLGLRQDKDGIFKPVTLHQTTTKKYSSVRKTSVKGIEWL